jgi:hypothetical protein
MYPQCNNYMVIKKLLPQNLEELEKEAAEYQTDPI